MSANPSANSYSAAYSALLPLVTMVTFAVVLWGGSLAIAHFMQHDLLRQVTNRPPSPTLSNLEKRVGENPKSANVHLELARARLREATENADSKLLMAAVASYKSVLELDPQNADALLELARLCSQNGIYDKALDFFPRYLTLRPNDLDAQSDYALVYLQTGDTAKAKELFTRLVSKSPDHFRGNLGLLLVAKEEGEAKLAEKLLSKVVNLAPSEEVRTEIKRAFQAEPPTKSITTSVATSPSISPAISPAAQVTEYFQGHQIIGPKIAALKWQDKSTLVLRLNDFPIEKMPAGMKELIVQRAQAKLQFPEKLAIKFVDASSDKELLAFSVGGASERGTTAPSPAYSSKPKQ